MFDMNQCKARDKLVCRDGTIAIYINKQNHKVYPHVVRIEDPVGAWPMSTTDLGNRYEEHESSNDIIGFYEEEPKMIERDKEYDLKVTGEQLAWIYFATCRSCNEFDLNDKLTEQYPYNWFTGCPESKTNGIGWDKDYCGDMFVWFNSIFTKPETPEQVKQRELREQYEATKKQLEELGKQLGIEN